MGDDNEGLAELVAQIEEELVEFGLVLGVEGAGGLISQNDGGTVDEGAGHGDTLFFTAGEFVGFVGGTVGQSHEVEQFLCALFGTFPRESCDIGGNHDILNRRKLRQELVELEHKTEVLVAEVAQLLRGEGGSVDAVDTYRTGVGTVEGADDL